MAMKLSEMMVDKKAQEEGEWVDWRDGVRVKVRSAETAAYSKLHEKLQKPYANILRHGGRIPREKTEEILIQCLAECVLVDWDGIIDDDGKPIKYTPEKALKFLTEAIDFRDFVTMAAYDRNNFRLKAKEAATKNSLPS